MSILGNRVVRVEDPRLLKGAGRYVQNVELPAALHLSFVGSPIAHGVLRTVETGAAAAAPGIVAVYTAADLPVPAMPCLLPAGAVPGFPGVAPTMARPFLATERVRFAGEPIVAILAEDPYRGADAAELVVIELDPLPAVVDPERALADEVLLFDAAETNLMCEIRMGDDADVLAGSEVVVRQRLVNRRIAPAPLEPRTAAAVFEAGCLTFYASTQAAASVRGMLAMFLGLDPSCVRVVAQDVGGGFGAKPFPSAEEILVAWAAIRTGRAVRWTESRSESLKGMTHGRGQVQTVELGARLDGSIVGIHLDVVQDCGAYPSVAPLLPVFTGMMASGPYRIPRVSFRARCVATTTTPVGAFRGAGRPEATYALERAFDLLAAELGIDVVDVRRRNLIDSHDFPHLTCTGLLYDSGHYAGSLDAVLAAAGYASLREEQRRRRQAGGPVELGIGVSTYVEITNPLAAPEPGRVRVNEDGSATVFTGSSPHGQGHETAWAMVASDRLGIEMCNITVIYGDTDVVPAATGTSGSRSAQTAGVVVGRAADVVVEQARSLAAELLEAASADVILDKTAGRFHVVGTPALSVSWSDVVRAAVGDLEGEATFEAPPSFPFGAHVAVVEVDTETGQARLRRLVMCDDCGTVLNPLIAEGQIHGGAAQGMSLALLEEIIYDDEANPLTSTFADYGIVSAAELPSFELVEQETPSPNNELGAKGIGESATIGSTPAIVSAVLDALSPYGVRHIDMPLTPMRVWQALQGQSGPRGD